MSKRAQGAEGAAGLGVLLGLLAAFLPWYSYTTATARITVDAFRASVLGDVFFLAIAFAALIVLTRRDVIADVLGARVTDRAALFAAAWCAAATVALQFVLAVAGGHSIAAGLPIAALASVMLIIAGWMSTPEAHRQAGLRHATH
jgi:hypothetical protein